MKPLYLLLFLLPVICLQSCKCKGGDKSTGAIIREMNELSCLFFSEEGFTISSQQELDSLLGFISGCDSVQIDFTQHTVLGFECSGSCNMKVTRSVEFDHTNMKCLYNLRVIDCGCWYKNLKVYHNVVLIPKIPAGYTVEFLKTEE